MPENVDDNANDDLTMSLDEGDTQVTEPDVSKPSEEAPPEPPAGGFAGPQVPYRAPGLDTTLVTMAKGAGLTDERIAGFGSNAQLQGYLQARLESGAGKPQATSAPAALDFGFDDDTDPGVRKLGEGLVTMQGHFQKALDQVQSHVKQVTDRFDGIAQENQRAAEAQDAIWVDQQIAKLPKAQRVIYGEGGRNQLDANSAELYARDQLRQIIYTLAGNPTIWGQAGPNAEQAFRMATAAQQSENVKRQARAELIRQVNEDSEQATTPPSRTAAQTQETGDEKALRFLEKGLPKVRTGT